ncbi:MAG: patatin-like phospholipase family protein [Pseudomonadota bacterium]
MLLLVAAGLLTGCGTGPERVSIPADRASAANIAQVELARFWGDEVTPALRALITEQYAQTRQAVRSGGRPSSAFEHVDFLAISGGGADGAFAAGYMMGWSQKGDRPQFEVVTGVSTGALAAPFVFLGPTHDQELREVFTQYGDSDIYNNLGLAGVMGRGLYDNAPLRQLINRYLTDGLVDEIASQYRIGRRLLLQTTNIDAQRPVIWDLSAIAASQRPDRRQRMIDILLASASIPAVFPPVRIDVSVDGQPRQELHVDGGTVAQLFFAPPNVELAGYERRNFGRARSRTLYLIRNGRLAPQYETTEESTLGIARRSIETLIKYQTISDLVRLQLQTTAARAKLYYTAIPDRFTLKPQSDFDRIYMQQLFAVGEEEGRLGHWRMQPPLTPVQAVDPG